MKFRGYTLDPFQERAVQCLQKGHSVLVSAPTGVGKTVIAEYAVEMALETGRKVIYTAPIKALSNQKFRDFSAQYGDNVGIKTGDVTINPDAALVIMTTEIFRNSIFDSPEALSDVDAVIFDEVHFLDDRDRGSVWEESIIFAPDHIRFIGLSATVPNIQEFAEWIRSIRPGELTVIEETHRPVPLRHHIHVAGQGTMSMKGLRKLESRASQEMMRHLGRARGSDPESQRQLLDHVEHHDGLPCLFFIFNRRGCEAAAVRNRGRKLLTEDEQNQALSEFDRLARKYEMADNPVAVELRALIGNGVAYHHAGVLPTLKDIIERIFSLGLIKLIFTTETFALGINMPARSVAFESVMRYRDRRLTRILTREHQQMAGRAGRRGIDDQGDVYTTIEWPNMDYPEVERLIFGDIEPIRSQFNMGYATLLSLYEKMGDRLFKAAEKSFYTFLKLTHEQEHRKRHKPKKNKRRRRQKGKGKGKPRLEQDPKWSTVRGQIEARLAFLRHMEYIDDSGITAKGNLARQVYGYEIQCAEIYSQGFLDNLEPDQLVAVFCALNYEGKKREFYEEPPQNSPQKMYRTIRSAIKKIRNTEMGFRIHPAVNHADFRLTAAVLAWSKGEPLEKLAQLTSIAHGDIVRALRMTIQLLRQMMWTLKDDDPDLADRLNAALKRINRGEVDAEKQLRLGVEPVPSVS